jgi:hypothetical protein
MHVRLLNDDQFSCERKPVTTTRTEENSHFFLQRTSEQQAKLIHQRKARRVRISIG